MSTILQNKWLNWLWMTSLILVILLDSITLHSFDRSFYQNQYEKLNTAQSMKISENELDTATGVLLDYIVDDRDNLDYQLQSGESFFNQKEIDHMVDVKNLYLSAELILKFSLFIFVGLSLYYLSLGKKRFQYILNQSFKHSFLVFGLVFGLIGLYALIDFDSFWTSFHHIFFRNDLWLLNPATDRLIQMVPLPFFNQLIFNILFTVLVLLIALTLVILFRPKQKVLKVHLVLYEPEIPQNTGNIMRTAMATNSQLHLIEPLGFVYDDKRIKRSGMDYIDQIEISRHDNWEAFLQTVKGELYFVTRYGEKTHSDFKFNKTKGDIYLVFGKESTGIPLEILASHLDKCMRIPMAANARSLNLANSVALVAYEVYRQLDYPDLSLVETQKGADWLRKHQ